MLGGGLESVFRVLFSAILHGVSLRISIRVATVHVLCTIETRDRENIFEIAAIFSLEVGFHNPIFGTYLFFEREMASSHDGLPADCLSRAGGRWPSFSQRCVFQISGMAQALD